MNSALPLATIGTQEFVVVLFGFEEEVGGDFHVGTAELVDADANVFGMVAGDADDMPLEVVTPAEHPDRIAHGKARGGETDGTLRLAEHALEHLDLTVGDDSREMTSVFVGGSCLVDQEVVDFRHGHNYSTLALCEADKDVLSDDGTLDLLLAAILPDPDLPLGGSVGLIT